MKFKNLIRFIAIVLLPMVSFISCDNDVPYSPWKFKIPGQWICRAGLDNLGIVTFYDDGTGVCAATFEEESAVAPFSYTYTKDKKELHGKLVITSTVKASDYPDLSPECIAFHPGEYMLSPTTTTEATIIKGDYIQWRISAKM